jgi:hypothetical protein
MKQQTPAEHFPPWPDDMEEALMAQHEKLQQISRRRERQRQRTSIRTRVIRWAIRIVIVGITFWLLCETVLS